MKPYYTQHRSLFFLWTDILLLNCSYLLTFKSGWTEPGLFDYQAYLNILLISNLLWIICVNVFRNYAQSYSSENIHGRFWRLLMTSTVHLVSLEIFIYLTGSTTQISENSVFAAYQVFTILAFIMHVAVIAVLWLLRKWRINVKRYVIIGDESLNDRIKRFYEEQYGFGYSYRGSFNFDNKETQLDMLENFIETEKPDFIYCTLAQMNSEQVKSVIRLAERKNTHVRLIPDLHRFLPNKLNIEAPEKLPIIDVKTRVMTDLDEQFLKRAFDLTFSSVVMILGLPIFVMIMVAVRISSKGSIFFLQERTGRWGKTFKIIKFRTMYADAHKYGLQHSLGAADPRITLIGKFLRRTRLDELPQFLNVLKGEMSIVGPRPLHKYDVDMLMMNASHQFQKVLTIRPGITSIGQIKVGYASNISENLLRLKYDMLYLNTYSLKTDLYLILLTIQVILLGKGK